MIDIAELQSLTHTARLAQKKREDAVAAKRTEEILCLARSRLEELKPIIPRVCHVIAKRGEEVGLIRLLHDEVIGITRDEHASGLSESGKILFEYLKQNSLNPRFVYETHYAMDPGPGKGAWRDYYLAFMWNPEVETRPAHHKKGSGEIHPRKYCRIFRTIEGSDKNYTVEFWKSDKR